MEVLHLISSYEAWVDFSPWDKDEGYVLACYFSGLGDGLAHVAGGDILRGDVCLRAPTFLLGPTRVCSATHQLVGVGAASRAIKRWDAGAGGRPWPQSGHTGIRHWRYRWCFKEVIFNYSLLGKKTNQCFFLPLYKKWNGGLQYPMPWMKYLRASITLAGCWEKKKSSNYL